MITTDIDGRAVLITGGTRGLGKAIAMEFSRAGAEVFVTHRWGSVAEDELIAEFVAAGHPAPVIIEADVSDPDATREVMAQIRARNGELHAVVSNVSFAKIVDDVHSLKKSSLDISLGYTTWPVVDLVQQAHEEFGRYPKYVLAMSSDGPEVCHEGYDLIGASKAALETLCRYLAVRLKPHGVRVNVVRAGYVDTPGARATFGDELVETVRERLGEVFMDPLRVGQACVALASGLLDAVTGQVIVVDEGMSLLVPAAYLTGRKECFVFPDERVLQ
ncbi:SDR family NAD(P)-dependent oxidoreductase [Actinokineospora sp.]|uniref:SDR family NAD(P)-dependent oxidoreductase n=1 Tax=Actinokineospora sp. TaxID=1872133 RepID=UPI0040376395